MKTSRVSTPLISNPELKSATASLPAEDDLKRRLCWICTQRTVIYNYPFSSSITIHTFN
ncbi:MAG: hypothetical protein IPN73_00155 [Saprospiraceae bacterium]|nr:hypothetical protein [Saprospiraceae bacterium]